MDKNHPTYKIHKHSAHSYLTYFVLFIIGVVLDLVFQFKIFKTEFWIPIGVILAFLATLLIFWAQATARSFPKEENQENLRKEHFCRGPYCYTRSPTHWGLFLLILGFAIIMNAFFVLITTVLSFILSRFTFFKHHEKALAEKYGTPYLEYKDIVKF